jgi:hypothetical protein
MQPCGATSVAVATTAFAGATASVRALAADWNVNTPAIAAAALTAAMNFNMAVPVFCLAAPGFPVNHSLPVIATLGASAPARSAGRHKKTVFGNRLKILI